MRFNIKKNIAASSAIVFLFASSMSCAQPADSAPATNPSIFTGFAPYITVSTSPYIAESTAYDASDIWSQQASMNEDLFLLQYRQQLEKKFSEVGLTLDRRPVIEISGAIEGVAQQVFNNFGNGSSGDVNLNTAELDINAMASKWATAFMTIEFDSAPPNTGSRVTNSRLYLSRGFVTIGNLDVTPVYFTIGQIYVPFGRYSSNMVTTPMTTSLARINDRAAVLGFFKDGMYAQAYVYPGIDSNASDTIFHAGGVNAGVRFPFGAQSQGSMNIGAGAVSDMTDSQGMGYTGSTAPEFPGFTNIDSNMSTYPFAHTIPGVDGHTEITYGPWSLALEMISATRSFATQDMTFNGKGADPKAGHAEVARGFKIYNQNFTAGLAFDHSWQALALSLPENSVTTYLRTSFWKNTVEVIEFRHDNDYSTNDTAVSAQNFGSFTNTGSGKARDLLLAQVGVYF